MVLNHKVTGFFTDQFFVVFLIAAAFLFDPLKEIVVAEFLTFQNVVAILINHCHFKIGILFRQIFRLCFYFRYFDNTN